MKERMHRSRSQRAVLGWKPAKAQTSDQLSSSYNLLMKHLRSIRPNFLRWNETSGANRLRGRGYPPESKRYPREPRAGPPTGEVPKGGQPPEKAGPPPGAEGGGSP